MNLYRIILFALVAILALAVNAQPKLHDSLAIQADTITFNSGNLQLKGLLWKPAGRGPFPAVLFNHGSEPSSMRWAHRVAGVFVSEGYAFFIPFRRGQSLSKGQGRYVVEAMDSAGKAAFGTQKDTLAGNKARSLLAIRLHETEQLQDQLAGLQALLQQPGIDKSRIAVGGISFGGIQTMLMAAEKTPIKAAVNFAGAAMMWNHSEDVQRWMKGVAAKARIPVLFVQAENDFSVNPSIEMAAVMKEKKLPHEVKIYPPNGTTPMDGHRFFSTSKEWCPAVFAFLKQYLR